MPNTAIANVSTWAGKTISGLLAEIKINNIELRLITITKYQEMPYQLSQPQCSKIEMSPSNFRLKIEGLKSLECQVRESGMNSGSLMRGMVPFGLELAQCDIIGCDTS